jgi:hypothetical protein
LYAVTALLLVARRVRPLACLTAMVVVSVVEFVAVGSPEGFAVSMALLIATYTVGNRLEWRRSWVGLALSVVVWVTWAVFDPMNTTFSERVSSLVWLTPSIIAWLLGALVRVTRLNAEQRRINREQRASQAVAEERNRIARELHDVIGHSVSVMTVQASAVARRSRLMHGVGIASMGFLMDAITDRLGFVSVPSEDDFRADLKAIADVCRWTSGVWEFGNQHQRRWNDLQNTPRDIQLLTNYLLFEYKARVWTRTGGQRRAAGARPDD